MSPVNPRSASTSPTPPPDQVEQPSAGTTDYGGPHATEPEPDERVLKAVGYSPEEWRRAANAAPAQPQGSVEQAAPPVEPDSGD